MQVEQEVAQEGPESQSQSGNMADFIWEQRCSALFKAWVQVRYHKRRQRFFDLMDKGTKAVTLVLGGTLFGKHLAYLDWVATGISALGATALVFGYGDRKQAHKDLAEQAIGLVAAIEEMPADQLTETIAAKWTADYARFCGKAPPPLKTLTVLCEHEQSVLQGHSKHVALPPLWRRCLSQIKD